MIRYHQIFYCEIFPNIWKRRGHTEETGLMTKANTMRRGEEKNRNKPGSLVKSLRYWTNKCCGNILPPDFLQSVLITSLDCKSFWMEFSVMCFQKILIYWLRFIFSQSPFWFVFGLCTLYLTWIACLAWEDLSYPEIIKKSSPKCFFQNFYVILVFIIIFLLHLEFLLPIMV